MQEVTKTGIGTWLLWIASQFILFPLSDTIVPLLRLLLVFTREHFRKAFQLMLIIPCETVSFFPHIFSAPRRVFRCSSKNFSLLKILRYAEFCSCIGVSFRFKLNSTGGEEKLRVYSRLEMSRGLNGPVSFGLSKLRRSGWV